MLREAIVNPIKIKYNHSENPKLNLSYLITRTLCGLANGNPGVIESMLGKMTDETNRGRAFSYWEASFGLRSIVGPMIGGLLVNTVQQYPHMFGNNLFLTRFPYFLPCFVSSLISIAGA